MTETGEDYLPSPCATNPLGGLTINGGVIGLPIIDRSPSHEAWFEAANWPNPA